VAALVALEQRCFRSDRLSARQYRRHLKSAHNRVLVAQGDGSLAGSAVVFRRRGSRGARLYSIAVDPAMRGRGLGAALLVAAEQAARRDGADWMSLEVRQSNRAAVALYESRGYRRTAGLPGYYADGADGWRYRKPLVSAR
jgi:ribosomal protein S18 acetylase RimI-like enzyme